MDSASVVESHSSNTETDSIENLSPTSESVPTSAETDPSNETHPSTETDTSSPETESVTESTCADYNNGQVYAFLKTIGQANTARKLISNERCPANLDVYAFQRNLRRLKDDYSKLLKNSNKNQIGAEKFRSFRDASYVYPEPAERPPPTISELEIRRLDDADTFAKVAFEIGGELNDEKKRRQKEGQKAKRKIDQLQTQVCEVTEENKSLGDALTERDADYKRSDHDYSS